MSTMQTPPPPLSSGPRTMSPMAVNSIIGSLVTAFGVVLVILSGGFVMLAAHILRAPLLLPWSHDIKDEIGFNMALGIIPSVCAIVTFIFGLTVVSRGLRKLTQQGA